MVLVVALIAAVGAVTYMSLGAPAKASTNSSDAVNGIKTIFEGSYGDYAFTVPAEAASPYLNCTFAVKGGSPNVIEVLVMNSTVFNEWTVDFANGTAFGSLPFAYSGGKANSGSFTVPVTAGTTYYLVLNDVQLYNEVVQISANVVG